MVETSSCLLNICFLHPSLAITQVLGKLANVCQPLTRSSRNLLIHHHGAVAYTNRAVDMSTTQNQYLAQRPLVLGLSKIVFLALSQIPLVRAVPVHISHLIHSYADEPEAKPPDDPSLWIYLGVAAALVLLGGAFAGLTIALMGQDEIYLQVIEDSGEGAEKKNAGKVLRLLQRGKHWVLVTLLLSNVITNETLPIVLDRSLGGGWPAVLGSTVLIGKLMCSYRF